MSEEKTVPSEETVNIPFEASGVIALMRRISEDAIKDMASDDTYISQLNMPKLLESPQALMTMLIRLKLTEVTILACAARITGKVVEDSADAIGITKEMCEIVAVSTCVYNELVDREIAKKLYPAIKDLDDCPVLDGTETDESPENLITAAKNLREHLNKVHLPNYPK